MMMARVDRPAPSDAGALSALLARGELDRIDAERARLISLVASVRPRRSLILEARLKQLTRRRVALVAAIARACP